MIIKIRVAINVHQPITAGILIGNANDRTHWVDFRYEKLPQVCFKCGILGHADNLCYNPPMEVEDSTPLGPWIRSNQYGRRFMEAKDRKFHSNLSLSKNYGKFSPPDPPSMVEQMAAMKIKDEEEARAQTHQQQNNPHYQHPEHNTPNQQHYNRSCTSNSNTVILAGKDQQHTITQAKRQRMETTTMEITMEESLKAGPVRQASHPQ
jgi:hypothetical protein